MLIDRVTITGFWRKRTVSVELFRDVNIFIGRNGSGKTTFLNILLGALKADLRALASNEFEHIGIFLVGQKGERKEIEIERIRSDAANDKIMYRIDHEAWTLPLIAEPDGLYRTSPAKFRELRSLQAALGEVARIGSLSVHRSPDFESYDDPTEFRRRQLTSPIDARVNTINERLTKFRLDLAERAQKVSERFQKEVLKSMLYDEQFDVPDFVDAREINLDLDKAELTNAYQRLRATDSLVENRINTHFDELRRCIGELQKWQEAKTHTPRVMSAALFALPLLKRTQHIVKLSLEAERQRQEIFEPMAAFYATLSEFMSDKFITPPSEGSFAITKDGATITTEKLSSGEKQLLILLAETVLQRGESYVFIADEPELSLHIEWQSKVLQAIKTLNGHAQLIVATHSPEIAAGWTSRLFEMDEVIHA